MLSLILFQYGKSVYEMAIAMDKRVNKCNVHVSHNYIAERSVG